MMSTMSLAIFCLEPGYLKSTVHLLVDGSRPIVPGMRRRRSAWVCRRGAPCPPDETVYLSLTMPILRGEPGASCLPVPPDRRRRDISHSTHADLGADAVVHRRSAPIQP